MPDSETHDPLTTSLVEGRGSLLDALDEIPVPLWVADRVGKLRWLNRAAISLFGRRVGAHFSRLVGMEDIANAREMFARKLNGTVDSTVQSLTLSGVAGSLRAELASVPVRRDGEIIGVMSIVRVAMPGADGEGRRPKPRLTPRQHQILELLAQGRSTGEIATALQISEATTRNHIRHLLAELRVHTRLEAVVAAFRNKWL